MLSLLGGNGFERSRRACLKFCQGGMAGLITSKSMFPYTKNQVVVELNHRFGVICRVFSLNARVMMCQLFHQEENWGGLCHWKDLWQEETVRIVTKRLASRANQLPEATYANDR